jgi:hypothetical protein
MPSPTATRRPSPATDAATSGDFSGDPKKKKKDLATGGGRDPPQRPGGEIRPPSVAIFASGKPTKKKKKKIRPLLSLRRTKKNLASLKNRF